MRNFSAISDVSEYPVRHYLELGQLENARKHFKEALAIDPNCDLIGYAKMQTGYKDQDLEHLKGLFEPLQKMYMASDRKTKRYVHKGKPTFMFEYPEGSKNLPLGGPVEVLHMKTPGKVEFYADVDDIPVGIAVADVGIKHYLPILKELGIGTNFEVVSNRLIGLKDGTEAYRTEIKWQVKGGPRITTLLVSAYKDDKWVSLSAHPFGDPEEVSWIIESLTFK
jgi:tetratricopeptide (TPR) repeat protein